MVDAAAGFTDAVPMEPPVKGDHRARLEARLEAGGLGGARGGAPIGEPKRFKGAAFPDCEGAGGGAAREAGGATAEKDADDDIVSGRADL